MFHCQILAQILRFLILRTQRETMCHGVQRGRVIFLAALGDGEVEPVVGTLRVHLDNALKKRCPVLAAPFTAIPSLFKTSGIGNTEAMAAKFCCASA